MKRLTLLAATAALWAGPVFAQGNCAPREAFETLLKDQVGARLISGGLLQDGTQIQTWANTETGVWAVIWSNGDVSCVQVEGRDFYVTTPPPNL